MELETIVAALNSEINRLIAAKNLLLGTPSTIVPQGISIVHKRTTMSPEGRASIAKAQRKRWRGVKKAQKIARASQALAM